MLPYAAGLAVKCDKPTEFHVDTRHLQPDGRPLFFGSVRIEEGRVAYRLMAVRLEPQLLERISRALRNRVCDQYGFAFARIDDALFRELALVTRTAYLRFRERGFA